jgi:hypothetical protein
MKKALWLLSLLVLTVSLTACGGSSGSSDTTTPTSGLSGAVAAAPVKDAAVMVDPQYLTATAKAAGKSIEVGRTDKTGAIVFNAAEVAKLDRTKNVVLYSKGGLKFTSVHDKVTDAQNAGAADEFNGTLRAILAPKATTAYLTVANTIIADMVLNQSVELVEAQRLVKKLVIESMSLNVMADPIGNPLTDVFNSEIVSQTLLKYCAISEGDLVAGTDVSEKISTKAKALKADAKATVLTDRAFIATNFAAIKQAVKDTLGKDFEAKADALKEEEIVSPIVRTIALSVTPDVEYVQYNESPAESNTYNVEVVTLANKPIKEGKYVLTARPATGKLMLDGENVTASTTVVYSGDKTFVYTLTAAEFKAMNGKDAIFTFKAVDGELVKDATATFKFAAKDQLIVTSATITGATELVKFANAGKDFASIADSVYNTPASAVAAGSITFTPKNATTKKETLSAVFTAPAGFQFAYKVAPGADDKYSIENGILTIKKEFTSGIAVSSQTIEIPADKIHYQHVGGNTAKNNAGKKAVTFTVSDAAGNLVVKGEKDDFYFIADKTENVVQSVMTATTAAVAADEGDYAAGKVIAGTGTNAVVVYAKTWNSVVGTAWNSASTALELVGENGSFLSAKWFPYSASSTMSFTDTDGSPMSALTASSQALSTDASRTGMYKMTLDATAIKVTDSSITNGGDNATFFFKAAETPTTEKVVVLPTVTTGGVKIAKPVAAGSIDKVTIAAPVSVTESTGGQTVKPANVTIAVETSAANASTKALLENTSTWTAAFVDASNAPSEPSMAFVATPVSNTNNYNVVVTFGNLTNSKNYTGKMTLTANSKTADALNINFSGN